MDNANHTPGRIAELDGLRGLAIGMVLLYHLFITKMGAPYGSVGDYALQAGKLAWSGVDLFFVLSGFLIGGILLDARTTSNYFQVFYTRRFFRIVPIYLVLLVIALALTSSEAIPSLTADALPWFPFLIFLQNFWMAAHANYGSVLLGVTWSLSVEEQFYMTLPLIVRFVNRQRLVWWLIAGIALAPMLRLAAHLVWPSNYLVAYTMMPCRADALLSGVIAALAVRSEYCRDWMRNHQKLFHVVLCTLLAGLWPLTEHAADFDNPKGALIKTFGYTWLALLYVCVLLYAVTWRDSRLGAYLRMAWLRWLGSIAYGVYLFHQPALYVVYALMRRRLPLILSAQDFVLSLTTLAATLALCQCSWLFFEKPLVNIGHRQIYKESQINAEPIAWRHIEEPSPN